MDKGNSSKKEDSPDKKDEKVDKAEDQAGTSKDDDLPRTMHEAKQPPLPDDDVALEHIRKFILDVWKISKKVDDPKKGVLDEVSVDGVVRYIKSDQCKKIVVMAGAGISTSAGIPDFRSPGSGLYDNLSKYKLPNPQAIFEIDFFEVNPKPFYALAKELFPGSYKPTTAHYFVRLLHEKNLLLRHYTQNIDGLEKVAAIPAEKIVEAHGTFYTSHCMACKKEYSLEWMKEKIFADKIPHCEDCQGLIKPDIVFFGENLPERFFRLAKEDFPKADLLIIMGSSLVVEPFASLVDRVGSACPRLLMNREKAGHKDRLMSIFGLGGGMDFDSDKNVRDVAFLGDCDDLCRQFADKLGWTEELDQLIKKST